MAGRRWIVGLGLVVAAAVIGAVAWQRSPHTEALGTDAVQRAGIDADAALSVDDAAPDAGSSRVALDSAATTAAPSTPPAAEPLVIPPDGQLDDDSLLALDRAARAGHAQAACRLGAELARCSNVSRMRSLAEPGNVDALAQSDIAGDELDQHIDRIAERQRRIDEVLADCAQITGTIHGSASDYFTLAATHGHVPSQIQYLSGQHLSPAAVMKDPAMLDHYRANARRFFDNAMAAGDLSMLQIWYFGSQFSEHMPLVQFLPEEWRDPRFLLALSDQLDDAQREGAFPVGSLGNSAEEPTRAQRDAAAALYRERFADSPPPINYMNADMAPGGRLFSLDRHRCEEPAR